MSSSGQLCDWPAVVDSADVAMAIPLAFVGLCVATLPLPRRAWPQGLLMSAVVAVGTLPLFDATADDVTMRLVLGAWASSGPAALVGAVREAGGLGYGPGTRLTSALALAHAVCGAILVSRLTWLGAQGQLPDGTDPLRGVPQVWFGDADPGTNAAATLAAHGSAIGAAAHVASRGRGCFVSATRARVAWLIWTLAGVAAATGEVLNTCDDEPVAPGAVCVHYHAYPVCRGGALVARCEASLWSAALPVWIVCAAVVAGPANRWMERVEVAEAADRPAEEAQRLGSVGAVLIEALRWTLAALTVVPVFWALVGTATGPDRVADPATCTPWDTWAMQWYAGAALGSVGFAFAAYGGRRIADGACTAAGPVAGPVVTYL